MRLNIAIVAFDYRCSKEAMKLIAQSDESTIKKISNDYIEMHDGTVYRIFPTFNHVRGHFISQLFIVDDFRWMVFKKQAELIDWIKYRLVYSDVPEEFQIQKYEW